MITYDLCKFNQVNTHSESLDFERKIIDDLIKKLGGASSQRVSRFNKTVVTKSSLGDIKIILNKITEDNFSELIIKLVELCDKIQEVEDIREILESINSRTMFFELSAKIYNELICNNKLFLVEAGDDFSALYDNINKVISFVSVETTYENLCKNNKQLDNIKNKVMFYTILTKYKLDNITPDLLEVLIQKLLLDMSNFVNIEIIYNIIALNISALKEGCYWDDIVDRLNMIKDGGGITNKVLFKTMDILDLIENHI